MTEKIDPFVVKFNEHVKQAEVLLFLTRSSELQREACERLLRVEQSVAAEKLRAIERGDEDYANLLLGCESVCSALLAELKMWILLKDGAPDDAWNELVVAQMAAADAMRAHIGFAHLEKYGEKLDLVEHVVFPPQVFISSGVIVKRQECSVCAAEYGECDHLVGRPYMGQFCHIIARDLSIDHIAIVENPADKRCRVQVYGVAGGVRNRMTWQVQSEGEEKTLQAEG